MQPKSTYNDSLHVVDLGVGVHACGNLLRLLCVDNMLPSRPSTDIGQASKEVDALYLEIGKP